MASSSIREFGDAARAASAGTEDTVPVSILGRVIEVEFPGTAQLAYVAAKMATVQNDLEGAGVAINFLISTMSDADGRYVHGLLLDKHSGFGIDEVTDLAEYLMEAWADGNPTSGSSASSRRPRTTGANSTVQQRRSQSTRSASRGAGS